MNIKYYPELDGVRAIAALMVMICHYCAYLPESDFAFVKQAALFGHTGVSLFFVLSGFLITRILVSTKNQESYFKNFFIRRALRIFPLYYGFLILYYFVFPYIIDVPIVNFREQIPFWVYLQDFALTFSWDSKGPMIFWSLAIEEHFYLFWPFIVYYSSKMGIKRAIFGLILLSFICRIILVTNGYEVFYFTFSRFDDLALGALLAITFNGENIRNKLTYVSGIVFTFIGCIILWFFFSGEKNDYIQVFKLFFIALAYTSVIGFILTLRSSNLLKKFLANRVLRYLGRISYGLYVFHPVCFMFCNQYLRTNIAILDTFINFAFTFLIASISFELFESRFLAMKSKYAYPPKPMPVP